MSFDEQPDDLSIRIGLEAEIARLMAINSALVDKSNGYVIENARLTAAASRWEYAKKDPGAVRHLLHLLDAGKGTADDLDKMVDRIIDSRNKSGLYGA